MQTLSQSPAVKLAFLLTLTAFVAAGCGITGSDDGDDSDSDSSTCILIESDDAINGGVAFDKGCYELEGLLILDDGELTVAAGTKLHFGPSAVLTVKSSLRISSGASLIFEETAGLDIDGGVLIADAAGEGADPILFVGSREVQGQWRGLRFADSPASGSRLVNVEVRHAGSTAWDSTRSVTAANILIAGGGLLEVNDASISDSGHHGISATNGEVRGCNELRFSNINRHSTYADAESDVCF